MSVVDDISQFAEQLLFACYLVHQGTLWFLVSDAWLVDSFLLVCCALPLHAIIRFLVERRP
jgi:hypothetical protein